MYQIIIEPSAREALAKISDRRIQEKITERISALAYDPEKQGKPLGGEFFGYRSLRAVGQRYRIIYHIERQKVIVFVVFLGIRKEGSKDDIYALAKKLLHYRLL